MKFFFILLLMITLLPTQVSADNDNKQNSGAYLGLGYHFGKQKFDNGVSFKPGAISLKLGSKINSKLAIEAIISKGHQSDTHRFLNSYGLSDVSISLKSATSILLKSGFPISEHSEVYGLLGGSQIELKSKEVLVSNPNLAREGFLDTEGLSFGFGLNSRIGKKSNGVSFQVEYLSLIREKAYNYSALNIGLVKSF